MCFTAALQSRNPATGGTKAQLAGAGRPEWRDSPANLDAFGGSSDQTTVSSRMPRFFSSWRITLQRGQTLVSKISPSFRRSGSSLLPAHGGKERCLFAHSSARRLGGDGVHRVDHSVAAVDQPFVARKVEKFRASTLQSGLMSQYAPWQPGLWACPRWAQREHWRLMLLSSTSSPSTSTANPPPGEGFRGKGTHAAQTEHRDFGVHQPADPSSPSGWRYGPKCGTSMVAPWLVSFSGLSRNAAGAAGRGNTAALPFLPEKRASPVALYYLSNKSCIYDFAVLEWCRLAMKNGG